MHLLSVVVAALCSPVFAQDEAPERTLFTNVHVFDGVNSERIANASVLVEGNLIKAVSTEAIDAPEAVEIDGGGRTLMPGLMDAHVHLALVRRPDEIRNDVDWMYVGAMANEMAEAMLLRGFTTVRDVGGPTVGLHRAIEEGYVVGPRLFSSGPFVTQTSGHGDLRNYNEEHPQIYGKSAAMDRQGWLIIADGPDEVTRAVREALRIGALQIKMMAGGGVSSSFDPLHTIQYTPAELEAGVTAAAQWGTYVTVHAYTDVAVRQAVEAGVGSIEHGPFLTEETMKLMAEKGVFLAPTARLALTTPEELGLTPGTVVHEKMAQVNEGAQQQLAWAREYGVPMVFSTDQFGSPELFARQSDEFLTLSEVLDDVEVLKMATSNVASLLELTGKLHPYKDGPLGVIEAGAYADILLVDGDPTADASILADYESNIELIMKDGVIYKNTLD